MQAKLKYAGFGFEMKVGHILLFWLTTNYSALLFFEQHCWKYLNWSQMIFAFILSEAAKIKIKLNCGPVLHSSNSIKSDAVTGN